MGQQSVLSGEQDGDNPTEYTLKVWQQPERARLCSFKEENDTIDRRPVDPPPIVELMSRSTDLNDLLDATPFFIRAAIVHPDPVDNGSGPEYPMVKTPTGADATAGDVIQTPEKLKAIDGTPGALVIFAKLSVRIPGIFRLKFTLYETSETGISEITSSVSEPFEVFSPKLFKGMKESTQLTRHLASQGLKIKLRTDTTVGRQSDSRRRPNQHAGRPATSIPTPESTTPPVPRPSSQQSPRKPAHPKAHKSVSSGHPSPTFVPHSHIHSSATPYPPTSGPASRSLVWRSEYNDKFPDSPSSRTSSPRRYLTGDDGMIPSIRDLTSRFSYASTPPMSDLSKFSLFKDDKRPDHSSNASSSRTSSTTSRPFSPFSAPGSSTASYQSSNNSSVRTDSPGVVLPPFVNRLNLGPGDDGMPVLPPILRPSPARGTESSFSSRHASGGLPLLPPPFPSYFMQSNGSGSSAQSPRPILAPMRGTSSEDDE